MRLLYSIPVRYAASDGMRDLDVMGRCEAVQGGEAGVMQGVATRPRRWALLVLALATLTVSLVACQASPGPSTSSSGNGGGLPLSSSGGGVQVSPTPTFPPFTIGAWPSDRSPAVNDTVTIYILCRVQDQSMKGPSTPPPAGQKIQVLVGDPINQPYEGVTGPDGIAAVPVTFNDPRPGYPVVVQVTTVWNGKTYTNETFFTPGATFKPTATPKHGGGPPPTATPGP